MYESRDSLAFSDMPDLSHRNPQVLQEIINMARWLVEEIGFDGFRFDFAKGYGVWTITALQEYRYMRDDNLFRPFGVGEYWSDASTIEQWIDAANAWNDNPVSAFDFPLRATLKLLCDNYGYSLRKLVAADTFLKRQPERTVTFVENHDLREPGQQIVNDKMLAYAYILTHEGYPCVYWRDYFNLGLAQEDTPNGIAALVGIHERYAGGSTRVLWVDDGLYIMERTGYNDSPGLIFVLNNRGDRWGGAYVTTGWQNTELKPEAWWSADDLEQPGSQWTSSLGDAGFWAPPRGYAVYVPAE
jgi:alpha-amylase